MSRLDKAIEKIRNGEELSNLEVNTIAKHATRAQIEEIVEVIKAEGLIRDSNTTPRSKTWNRLGLVLHREGRSILAKNIFEAVVQTGSTNAATQNNFAKVLIETGELVRGKEFLIRAYNQDIRRPEYALLPAYANLSLAMIMEAKQAIKIGDRINALVFAWLSIESSLRREWMKFILQAVPTREPTASNPFQELRDRLADWGIRDISDFLNKEVKTIDNKLAGHIKSVRRYRNALFHLTGDLPIPTKGEIQSFIKLAEELWHLTL